MFEMRCWRRMEEVSWNDCVKQEKTLKRGKAERNIQNTVRRREVNFEHKENTRKNRHEGSSGRRPEKLLDGLTKSRPSNLKQKPINRALWTCQKTGYAQTHPVVHSVYCLLLILRRKTATFGIAIFLCMIVQMCSIPTFQSFDIFLRAQFVIYAFGGQPCTYLLDSHMHIYWTAMCIFIDSLSTATKAGRNLEFMRLSRHLFHL